MGAALAKRSGQLVQNFASLAHGVDVVKIHQDKGVDVTSGGIEKCPHASKALAAARVAEELASAKKRSDSLKATKATATAKPSQSTSKQCPVHADGFNYEKFYADELQKKHDDKSYRYFNTINRLATKFPVAHTANTETEVEVWCANDYLGMGNNPIVLETMQ
jgi:5-aminolevulinate synthase